MAADWNNITLGDFVTLQRGHDLTADERKPGNVPVMGAAGQNGFHNTAIAKAPGIVIGRSGGSFGQVHFSDTDYWPHNTGLYVTDFKGNDPYFAYYLLKWLNFDSYNSGSAQPSLNRNFIYPIKIRVPKPKEQTRIATVLAALDAKIALNHRINVELEGMAKLLYDYWFVQYDFPLSAAQAAALGKPRLAGQPYRSSGGPMVYHEQLKREIPKGWVAKELSDIAEITMGQSPPGHTYNDERNGVLFFQGSTDFGWRYPSPRQYTTAPTRMAKKGDILLSVRAPVGTLNIAPEECAIGRGLSALRSKSGSSSFLFQVLRNLQQVFARRNGDGTTFGSINRDDLRSLKLAYPSEEEIVHSFDRIVSGTDALIFANHQQNQELTTLRDWLLPMLMNGQVRVAG
jgi:type I restriction enzyme S subunit